VARSLLEKLAAQRATNAAAASDRLPISDLRAGIAYKIGGASDTMKF
jgi:hypothetical protein